MREKNDILNTLEKEDVWFVDPYGHWHKSFNDMCYHFRKNPTTVKSRLEKGVPLKIALEYNGSIKEVFKGCYGAVYVSERELVDYEGLLGDKVGYNKNKEYKEYCRRKKQGYCLEYCLGHIRGVNDEEYTSWEEALKAYNVLQEDFDKYKDNYSKRKILGTKWRDYLGHIYMTKEALCQAYNISEAQLDDRRKSGESLSHITRNPCRSLWRIHSRFPTINVFEIEYEANDTIYYSCNCTVCNENHIWSYHQIEEHSKDCGDKYINED